MDNFSQSCQIHLIDKSLRFFLRLIKHTQIPRIILDSFILHHIFLAEYNLFSKALSFSPVFSTKLISLRFPFLTFFQPPDISIVTFFRGYSMYFVTFFRVERQVRDGVSGFFRKAKKATNPVPIGSPQRFTSTLRLLFFSFFLHLSAL